MGENNKPDRLYAWAVRSTVFIAILGFIFSYITLFLVAGDLQMNIAQQIIFPLLLDLFMVVAHLTYFHLSKIGANRGWVTASMYLTVALSVLFNLSHVWDNDNYLMWVAWSLPPVILLLSVKTITVMVRTHQEPERSTGVQPAFTIERPVEQIEQQIEQPEPELNEPPDGLNKTEQAAWVIEQNPGLSTSEYERLTGASRGTVNNAKKLVNNGHQK